MYASGQLFTEGSRAYVGGISGQSDYSNSFSDVHVNASLTEQVSGESFVGGLVGRVDSDLNFFTRVSFQGNIVSNYNYVGGIVGYSSYFITVNQAASNATIQASSSAGGLFGYVQKGNFNGLLFSGSLSAPSNSSYVGGIFGNTSTIQVQNAMFNGTLVGGWYVGGIVGYSHNSLFKSVVAQGTINGTSEVGGLIGLSDSNTLSYSYSNMTFVGTNPQGNYGALIGNAQGNNATKLIETFAHSSMSLVANGFNNIHHDSTYYQLSGSRTLQDILSIIKPIWENEGWVVVDGVLPTLVLETALLELLDA
jgi:hypothetical protein